MKNDFLSRTLAVINDLSVEEQLFLYNNVRKLKEKVRNKEDISEFQIKSNTGIYIVFLESSTRTKESFINAAKFHKNAKVNIFDSEHSSFNKQESYVDTFNMLTGYSDYSIFVLRTRLEGVCRLLEQKVGDFADRHGIVRPAFINGGDGKHEHPTQELLDEYTFLEQNNFDNSHIRIALVGDLLHGRTVHSKADGLKVFKNVEVDLVAPQQLQMPQSYVDKMRRNGFQVRIYNSIDEYLSYGSPASIWYFTRLQLERMGEDILEKAHILKKAVTFRKDLLDKLPEDVKFYHPLPRPKIEPEIPTFLDNLPLNGWEGQAINGYWVRVVLLSMFGGALRTDFDTTMRREEPTEDFIVPAPIIDGTKGTQKEGKRGIKPIDNGTVIDHIAKGKSTDEIYNTVLKIRKILKLYDVDSADGIFKSADGNCKGYISLPDRYLSFKEIKKLSAISPNTTVNIVKNGRVEEKYRINLPPRIYGFDEIRCKNENCITNPVNGEGVNASFVRVDGKFICEYCETPHEYHEIWNI
ncbi:MAG TPA: bifunctional aspartate carbamoyltransferase catalytic subunit/aspartate carbamoyltransferase regulatory subunit [Fervidobacterium sp.]|nr:bifunctional aspartate carbamoyltransferase catalytic subunit/aspartate carbamoyltransferase regulatory subunit [Thermotogaceae bacterium]HOK33569.1 bifunctional aspartate carbamoyltransferase catalytic subunit/aspartate carbamoyltransferase regulatory subunit [Fervidobacterium sp.]HOL03764.1 bifunctional aspartate carbamoyltransferase catalytic subunit/aspartate carbamoyltransferase regulatory subunit [Fervidobacterium sp.]HON03882.1 bifunctional aspartate carbamoyltransferase catalytic subu